MLNNKAYKKKVTFCLSVPEARNVHLAGDFNEWQADSYPLKPYKNGDGTLEWRTTLHLQPGTYQYRYVVDGEWRNDPASQERVPNEFGTYNDVIRV